MKPRLTLYLRDMRRESPKVASTPSLRRRTRGDCENRQRPCPFISCRHHLFIDVTPAGSISMPFGESEDDLWEMKETCSLDVAQRGDHDTNVLGKFLGVTAARIQQEVVQATAKLRMHADEQGLKFEDLFDKTAHSSSDENVSRLALLNQRENEPQGKRRRWMIKFLIQKARRRVSRVPLELTDRNKERFAQQAEEAVRADFLTGIQRFKQCVPKAAIDEAFNTGGYDAIRKTIPWHELDGDMSKTAERLSSVVDAAAHGTITGIYDAPPDKYRTNADNPKVAELAKDRIGRYLQDLSDEHNANIHEIVQRSKALTRALRLASEMVRGLFGFGASSAGGRNDMPHYQHSTRRHIKAFRVPGQAEA